MQDVSYGVVQGETYSVLGPNEAGKSATISMLCCLLQPNAGDALGMGHSIRCESGAVRSAIGAVPQEVALYSDLVPEPKGVPEQCNAGGRAAILSQSTLAALAAEEVHILDVSLASSKDR